MDYSVYMSDDGMKKCKLGAYKTHIIKNIEKIGQKKLVVIGGGEDYDVAHAGSPAASHEECQGSGYCIPRG